MILLLLVRFCGLMLILLSFCLSSFFISVVCGFLFLEFMGCMIVSLDRCVVVFMEVDIFIFIRSGGQVLMLCLVIMFMMNLVMFLQFCFGIRILVVFGKVYLLFVMQILMVQLFSFGMMCQFSQGICVFVLVLVFFLLNVLIVLWCSGLMWVVLVVVFFNIFFNLFSSGKLVFVFMKYWIMFVFWQLG